LGLIKNDAQKWAFIHIPKTGGTSLTSIIQNIEGSELVAVHDSIRVFEDVSDFFIFTIVRNPFTRIASAYSHRLRKNEYQKSFGEFITELSENHLDLIPQSYYINAGKDENKQVSFIAKYENYTHDIQKILKKINHRSSIPHLNRNPIYDKHPHLNQEKFYRNLYSQDWMIENILERYKDDFKIFNYELDLPR